MKIETEYFYLRELSLSDVNETYLGWLKDQSTSKFIETANQTQDLNDLKKKVSFWIESSEILFLGIFDKERDSHIGNIKFTPLNIEENYTILGILIGDENFRGTGVAKEIINACGDWLKDRLSISRIVLGVDKENYAAIKAYKKAGFNIKTLTKISEQAGKITMVREL